jgi:hypothetical protein
MRQNSLLKLHLFDVDKADKKAWKRPKFTNKELLVAEIASKRQFLYYNTPAKTTTAIVGKWHIGDSAGRRPTDHGFDEGMAFRVRMTSVNGHPTRGMTSSATW